MSASCFLAVFEAEILREDEVRSAVFYLADALRMLTENTANLSGGRYIRTALADLLADPADLSDDVSGEDVIGRIKKKLSE